MLGTARNAHPRLTKYPRPCTYFHAEHSRTRQLILYAHADSHSIHSLNIHSRSSDSLQYITRARSPATIVWSFLTELVDVAKQKSCIDPLVLGVFTCSEYGAPFSNAKLGGGWEVNKQQRTSWITACHDGKRCWGCNLAGNSPG